MSDFADKLSALCAAELPRARRDPERLSIMLERLTHSLAMTIAVGSAGDNAIASTLLDGAQNYMDETTSELMPMGKLISRGGN